MLRATTPATTPARTAESDSQKAAPKAVAGSKTDVLFLEPDSWRQGTIYGHSEAEHDYIMAGDHPPLVQLIFTDAAGVQWWRDTDGNLELWKRPSRKPGG